MKKPFCVLALSGLVAISSPTWAAEESGFYAGIGTGRLDFDFSGVDLETGAGRVCAAAVSMLTSKANRCCA